MTVRANAQAEGKRDVENPLATTNNTAQHRCTHPERDWCDDQNQSSTEDDGVNVGQLHGTWAKNKGLHATYLNHVSHEALV